MDFNDTAEDAAFRAEARAFLAEHVEALPGGVGRRPSGKHLDPDTVAAARAWQKTKAGAGWACLTWPQEIGGRGATPIQKLIFDQEEATFVVPDATVFGVGIGMCGPTLLAHGTAAQKEKWIPKLVSGEEIWCQLFSEPSAGSDLAGLRTTAMRDGDSWLLNGQKIWTSAAHCSEWGVIVCRTDAQAAKHAGLSYFVVNMKLPGIEIRPITQIDGGQGFSEVFFSDVRIPDAWRIDAVGNGWRVALTTLMNERASLGGAGGGSLVESLIELARTTPVGGGRAMDDSGVRQRIADFYVRSKGIEFAGHRLVTTLSQGGVPGPEASLGKLVAGPLLQEIARYGIDLSGQAGVLMESSPFQRTYLAVPALRIAGGTDEVLRNIVAERVLGLPPEARVDKGIAFQDIPTGPDRSA